ncbi:hypothetical protein [Aridibaculum aurantiacum]|uniref:hypothetical protein n=1 Tax=Aridibaculum aurantiacum TaxID=2810307 RepID=UPI001A96080A|nr:hypothetical protein [Aridibaculum aurantiacum]
MALYNFEATAVDPAAPTPEEEEELTAEQALTEESGLETGATYKEDEEQDLDDLIHKQPASDE